MRFLRQTLLLVCLILPCLMAIGQPPTTVDDAKNGNEDTDITINVLGNDIDGGSAIDPSSVDLNPGGGIDPSFTVTEGTFLVDALGVVTFTPLPDFSGTVTTISYTVEGVDDQVSLPAMINVTVDPLDDPPTIGTIGNQTTAEDVSITNLPFTIADPDGFGMTNLSGASDNDAIIPDGNISFGGSGANRTVTLTPLANQNGGPVAITIEVGDGTATASTTFDVTVTAVDDDPPTIDPISNQTVAEDGAITALPFTIADPDGFVGVTVSGASDTDAIIPDGNIIFGGSGANRTVTITPLPNQNGGPVTITITVNDGTSTASTNFNVTVTPSNDPPTIAAISNQTVAEDGAITALPFTIGDPDGFTGVTVSGASDNDAIIPDGNITFGGSGANRTVTITPLPNQNGGPVTITITVNDGSTTASTNFNVTVTPSNDPPTIATISNQTVAEDGAITALPFTIGDPDGFTGVTVSGASNNDAIIPDGNVIIGGSGANRTVTITPLPNQNGGPVTITITVNDGTASASTNFNVTVTPVNDAPTIATISNQTVAEDGAITALPFTIGDLDGFTGVTVSGASDNDAIIPDGNITFGGSGANRTVTITPLPNQSGGPVTITITVSDGTANASTNFNVTVTPSNDPPTIATISNQTVAEDGAITALPFTIGDPDGFTGVTVSGASNNDAIIPDGNVVIGGSGANRTVTITPLPNQNGGPVTITITVNDGSASASTNFNVTVTPVNDAPTIATISNQTVAEDGAITALPFTIGDPDGFTGVTVSGASNNDAIIPDGNVTFGGSGANRTVTITPLPNQNGGPVTITITVSDGTANASTNFNVTVTPSNDPPTIAAISNQTVAEDGAITALPFTIGDPDGFTGVTVSGASDNDAIIPDGNITFGGSGANRTVTITPLPNQNGGPVTITLTVSDGSASASTNFNVTVTPSNDPPTIATISNQTVAEDGAITALPFTIGDPDGFTGVTVSGASNNDAIIPDGNITFGGSGANRTVTITPLPNQNGGPVTITITVSDGTANASTNFNVTVTPTNDAPTIATISNQTVAEDGAITALPFTIGDPDGFTGVTVSGASDNDAVIPDGNITFGGSGPNRTVTITPLPNQNGGPVIITITVSDGTANASTNFNVTVTPSNDAPTIATISNQTVAEDGAITALPFTIGDIDNPAASLVLAGASNLDAIIPDANITFGGSGANRTVTVTPLPNQNGGPVTITITVGDGAATATTTFNVTVSPVNDAPTIAAISNQTVAEDAAITALPFTIGDADGFGTTVLSGTSNNAAIIPDANITFGGSGANRTVTVTPLANQNGGPVTITITVGDGTATATTTFDVTVTPVNDAPTIAVISNQTVAEDGVITALPFTIGDIDNPVAGLALAGASNMDAVIPDANVTFGGSGANRTVTITPLPNQNGGPVAITITVGDGAATATRNFNVTVTAVNDAPTITPIDNQAIAEDTSSPPLAFTVSDIDTPAGSLTVTGSSNATAVIPNANIVIAGTGANRTVTLTPAPEQSGLAVITLTVSDGTSNVPMSFAVTVTPVSDPPTITTIPNQLINEDATTGPLAFTLADIDNPVAGLTVTAASDNVTLVPIANIVFGGSGANRTITVTPATDQSGIAIITVTVSDGTTAVPTTFQVTVDGFNDPPTISAIANQSTSEDLPTAAIPFTVGDPETPASDLTVTASSDNVGVVPNANIMIAGSGANRNVTITPEPNQSGAAIITLTVSDGVNSTPISFQVTVNTVDDAPTITTIPNQTIAEDAQTTALPFTINDVETPIPSLTVTRSSDNLVLVPLANVVLAGSGANQTVQVTPVANQFGTAVITVSVGDGANTTSTTFQVVVTPVNDVPTITAIPNQTVNEDIPTGALSFTITDIETPVASLTVSGNSDNTTLVPVANIVFTGSGGTRTVTVTPAANQAGVATLTIIVNDGTASVSTTFQLTVNPVNDAPVITGQTTVSTAEEQPLVIKFSDITVTDVDNNFPADFTLTVLTNPGYTVAGHTITPNSNVTGTINVRVQVNDGVLNSNIYNVQVNVTPVNDPPVITAQSTLTIAEDTPLTFALGNITIVDPDNSSGFTFLLATGSNYSVSGGNLITPAAHFYGTLTVPVTVNDGTSASAPFNLQIQVTPVNDKPQITGQTPISIAEVQPVTLDLSQLTVFDPDNNYPADFELNVSTGPNYSAVGNVVTPVVNFSGTLLVRVKVSDGLLESDYYDFQILVNSTNDPPVITGQRPLNTEEGEPLQIQFVDLFVSDPDNTYPTGFTLIILPGTTYTFVGTTVTPNPNVSGIIDVRVKVNDGAVDSAPYLLKIDVNSVNDAPAITGQLPMTALEDAPVITMSMGFLIISDPDSPISGFSMTVSPGNNYTLSNGVEIKPDANFYGTLSVPVVVNDGFLDSQPYNVQIQISPVNDAPTITGQNTLSAVEDQPIILKLEDFLVADIDNTFPAGFSLQVAQGSFPNYDAVGTTVTPRDNFTGTLSVAVTVSDGAATSGTYNAAIFVGTINDPPTIDPINAVVIDEDPAEPKVISLTGITAGVGEGGTQLVTVTISTNEPTWFEVFEVNYTGSTLGTVRLKPIANQTGTAQVTVRVQDDGLATAPHINFYEYTFDFTISPVNDVPTFTKQPLKLAETTLAYEYDIEVADIENGVITITAPTLPSWLILTQGPNGHATLSGIPPLGTTGEVPVIIVATDPMGSVSTQEFQIIVNTRPTITPFAITTEEDHPFDFGSEFLNNYSDEDGDPLFEIQIKQLPTKGKLFLDNVLVSLDATIPEAQLKKLKYQPSTDSNGTDIIKWNASDGVYFSHLDANILISIIPFNDPPEIIALEAPETDTLQYEMGSEVPVKLTEIFDARDPEGDNIIGAEIGFQVSTEYRVRQDVFSFRDTLGIRGAFIEELGVLTLTGKAPVEDYVAAIRTVRYNYLDALPEDISKGRKVSIRLTDGNFGGTKERLVGLIYTNPGLDIANAFTPNGDEENRYWRIYSPTGLERYKDALIRVFDKRGVLVYQATGFSTPWNGDGPEGALPSDSYYYTIDLKYDKKKYKGVVTILR